MLHYAYIKPRVEMPAVPANPKFQSRVAKCRYGTFHYWDEDELVGLALATYGEYSEAECEVYRKCLRPGFVAIDVGANIGAFTVPMAQLVGPTGKVYAFEASYLNVELLKKNVAANCPNNVEVLPLAASDSVGTIEITNQDALHAYCRPEINEALFKIECTTIDSLNLQQCNFIKVDVDRHELQVLKGARETIKRCLPVLYIENEHPDLREALVAEIIGLGYRLFWHKPYQYNPANFNGVKRNIFSNIVSFMNVCIPDQDGWSVKMLEEVSDYRSDDNMFNREAARYEKYCEHDPDDLQSRWLAAHYHNLMQRNDRVEELIAENLRRDPNHVPTRALTGFRAIQRGQWDYGWECYELRFLQPDKRQFGGDRDFGVPRWDGSPTDEPVLIWSEQGFGDGIMFARFMKYVRDRAPNAFLEVRPELYELFDYSRALIDPGLKVYRLGRSLPYYGYHCSLPSTPYALKATEDMIKIKEPYLDADPLLIKNWKGQGNIRIGSIPLPLNGARIGLCLKGSTASERPQTRDLPEELFIPIMKRYGPFFPLEQQGQFESYMMTAALIKALELVITVDTSICHLAGALGVPTLLLLSFDCDFRWGLEGESCLWYPSVKILRQDKFREWVPVLDKVTEHLDKAGFEPLGYYNDRGK